ncbi:MAG: metal ABC transporter substrate-binding protein [Planctomycetota bacterium]|jgi:zinc/manganese transport system substrate-binding protein/zinc transport system substrate-binding protein|nr:metal ABC transporter substrate-binding protein [Planctomycetota bacterium]
MLKSRKTGPCSPWLLGLAVCLFPVLRGAEPDKRIKLLCTTFPVYQITRNIALGSAGAEVELMIPAPMGCPHDYTLTPDDMKKLEAADALIVNGLGLEEFLGSPVEKANNRLIMIDSSAGIEDLLPYEGEEHDEDHEDEAEDGHGDEEDHEGEEAEHAHVHEGINSHLFVSPSLSARMGENIAAELARLDPPRAGLYADNARRYRLTMDSLSREAADLGRRLANNRIVEPHGAFDYLARDMGLAVVGVLQPHGIEPSASGILALLETIRREKPGAIFIEPQYSDRTGRLVSAETGIGVFLLDPAASGPEEAPIDYFETVMRTNLATIAEALGTK